FHQPVIRRMKLDLVDTLAKTVERLQLRLVLIRLHSKLNRLGAAGKPTKRRKPFVSPVSTIQPDYGSERLVALEHVVIGKRCGMIEYGMSPDDRFLNEKFELTSAGDRQQEGAQRITSRTFKTLNAEHESYL